MTILLAIIIFIAIFIYWLRLHARRYYDQKLKDMNEGNLEE